MAYQLSNAQPGLAAELARAHAGTPARPAFAIQVNALQAMCRQVFGFRLAMIAIATPYAISRTAPGLPTWFVGSAILVTFMGSYLLFRDWERFGPVLLRHPWLLAVDVSFGALLLITATPESTLAYVTVCTPLLAGLVQGWRGAAVFAALQVVIVFGVYASVPKLEPGGAPALLLPGFCVIAGAVGVTLRNLLLRFGTATQALTETRARLAVNEAVEGERTRLAREMHDSVAKTLHGLALAADGLAGSAGRMDPPTVKLQAELVARAARRAAAESRELLTDLRREQGLEGGVDLVAELAAQAQDFTDRHPVTATFRRLAEETPVPPVPQAVARQLLTVASEALENAHRHAGPSYLIVLAGVKGDMLRISVYDDGRGLPAGTTLDTLRRAGHFGLVGMVERAASIGARIRIGRGNAEKGTEVRVELPLAALTSPAAGENTPSASLPTPAQSPAPPPASSPPPSPSFVPESVSTPRPSQRP
ncbi:histidine kinase [Streptomyces sp. CA-278952]|uniref:sensor histidine kinase n=1 Tax=unclassified Streptomyces TaxID=2593676 RepID=UPI002242643C|nr:MULTISPECIES: histidine kinase [unclassified Streptomyces]UZI29053.1 histidine kinase [Streptomyces sp. VB1]WDG29002.1 histidine kinase [Streptomyces sp. CA-278952]